jgi:hypothetical protein
MGSELANPNGYRSEAAEADRRDILPRFCRREVRQRPENKMVP